jgi:phage tail tape-measure protein
MAAKQKAIKTTSGALKGASTGATIGSIVPGIGTAIGAGIGAIAGGLGGLFGGGKKKGGGVATAATPATQREVDVTPKNPYAGIQSRSFDENRANRQARVQKFFDF